MPKLTFAISADYARATGGYIYDMRLVAELRALGWTVDEMDLPAGFPDPSAEAIATTRALFASLPENSILLIDQLCISVIPEVAAAVGGRLKLSVILHHPLADEGDRPPAAAAILRAAERETLQHAALVIATSELTAATLRADYAVPNARLIVALPGIDRPSFQARKTTGAPNLLSIGSVIPRKDHGALIMALMPLADRPWQLTIVGDLERAPAHVAGLRAMIAASRLEDRVTLPGALSGDALETEWNRADAYVAASRHEGFGMAIAEAIARGLPVVTTEAGAVGGWIDRRAALVAQVGDQPALNAAMARIVTDAALRARLAEGSRAAITALPSWPRSATIVANALARL